MLTGVTLGPPAVPPHLLATAGLDTGVVPDIPAGKFGHVVELGSELGHRARWEEWIAADGRVWRHDLTADGDRFYAFDNAGDRPQNPSPRYLAHLPTDPKRLETVLRQAPGVHSDQELFEAGAMMLESQLASSALRAAVVSMLVGLRHVQTSSGTDRSGRPAEVLQYDDGRRVPPWSRESLYLDRRSNFVLGDWLEGANGDDGAPHPFAVGGTYSALTITDSIPPEVIDNAEHG